MTKEATAFWRGVVPWMGHALEADMGSNTKETCHIRRCAIHLFGCALGTTFASILAFPLRLAFRRE
jgi:hypothetical protein